MVAQVLASESLFIYHLFNKYLLNYSKSYNTVGTGEERSLLWWNLPAVEG